MIRFFTYVVVLLAAFASHAQLILKPIEPYHQPNARTSGMEARKAAQQVLTLPFWEDFSSSAHVPDSNKWETGDDVFVNSTLAQNPPTYKVATFDGLKADGRAHNMANNFNGPGDSLVSQPIDLSLVNEFNRNAVFLSFYWQVRGYGEMPDQNDSLRLQLLLHHEEIDSSEWVTVWSVSGGPESQSDNFTQTIIHIEHEGYFHKDFRMKFQSFSSQRGPFDTWHVDYIYLNEGRNGDNIYYQDRSLSGAPSLLLAPYHEVPASHFFHTQQVTRQQIVATNLDNEPHPISYSYEIRNVSTKELYYASEPITISGFTGYNLGVPIYGPEDISLNIQGATSDSVVISSSFIYNTEDSFLSGAANVNDSITTRYTLHNYYAYDDGTAEFAAAINQLAGQVAVRFGLSEPDTITHLDIYFPNIAPDASGSTVDLIIWDRLNDRGERYRQSHTIQPPHGLNKFTRIELTQPVITRDTVYIGYQQFRDNFIGIGFDRNNAPARGNIFTNISGVWEQNERLEGVLMIRPVFEQADTSSIVLANRPELPDPIMIYPNPSRGIIKVTGNYELLLVYNMSGQLMHQSGNKAEHDLQILENGLYLVKVVSGSKIMTQKLLISR